MSKAKAPTQTVGVEGVVTETREGETGLDQPVATAPEETTTKPPAPKPLTVAALSKELAELKQVIQDHAQKIADLDAALAKKRQPTTNGKVQVHDKQTGKVYPSKNNAYQSLLKAGELKELVDKVVFGTNPAKNNFGWYVLKRAWPDRFEEVKHEGGKA